jgi:redox-sensitive bicupin YhaK (pirin superfamily)
MGNKGHIKTGECQWMTAGSGIIHQEMPQPSQRMLGTQLWLNLPAKNKMSQPVYRSITQQSIPVINGNGVQVRIISGVYNGTCGAIVGDYVKALYLDIEIKSETEWTLSTEPGHTLFIYLLSGEAHFKDANEHIINEKHAVLFGSGDVFKINSGKNGVRFLLMSGNPLKEPIAWGGPIVMNTREELDIAFGELENNTFIKH